MRVETSRVEVLGAETKLIELVVAKGGRSARHDSVKAPRLDAQVDESLEGYEGRLESYSDARVVRIEGLEPVEARERLVADVGVDGIVQDARVDDRKDLELGAEGGEDDGRLVVHIAMQRDLRLDEHAEVTRVEVEVLGKVVGGVIGVDVESIAEGVSPFIR